MKTNSKRHTDFSQSEQPDFADKKFDPREHLNVTGRGTRRVGDLDLGTAANNLPPKVEEFLSRIANVAEKMVEGKKMDESLTKEVLSKLSADQLSQYLKGQYDLECKKHESLDLRMGKMASAVTKVYEDLNVKAWSEMLLEQQKAAMLRRQKTEDAEDAVAEALAVVRGLMGDIELSMEDDDIEVLKGDLNDAIETAKYRIKILESDS